MSKAKAVFAHRRRNQAIYKPRHQAVNGTTPCMYVICTSQHCRNQGKAADYGSGRATNLTKS